MGPTPDILIAMRYSVESVVPPDLIYRYPNPPRHEVTPYTSTDMGTRTSP